MLNKEPNPKFVAPKISTITSKIIFISACQLPRLICSFAATARFISVHGSVPRFTCIRKDKVTPMLRTASKAMKSLGQKFFFPINPLSKFFIILLFSFCCSMEIFPASYGNCLFSRISAIFLL